MHALKLADVSEWKVLESPAAIIYIDTLCIFDPNCVTSYLLNEFDMISLFVRRFLMSGQIK